MRLALDRIGSRQPREGRGQAPVYSSTPIGRGGADGQKRRFVRDGEVPVMMVSGVRAAEAPQQRRSGGPQSDQLDAVNAALRAERAAHEAAERALREAQVMIQDLRTKLGHLSMARDEALETARRAEATHAALAHEVDTLNFRLAAEVAARARAERAAQLAEPPTPVVEVIAEPPPAMEPMAPRRRGRPAKVRVAAEESAVDAGAATPARRGRPPKAARPELAADAEPAVKRGRGRPPKVVDVTAAPKRRPGRPRIEREPEPVKWWLPKSKAG